MVKSSSFEKTVADFFEEFRFKPVKFLYKLGIIYHEEQVYDWCHELDEPERLSIVYHGITVTIFKKERLFYKNLFCKFLHWNPKRVCTYSTSVSKDGMSVIDEHTKMEFVEKAIANTWKQSEKALKEFEKEIREILVETDDDSEPIQQQSVDKE